jgi:hypothetical protein
MLKETEPNKGQLFRGTQLVPRDTTPTLTELGIDKKISSLSKKIADLTAMTPKKAIIKSNKCNKITLFQS